MPSIVQLATKIDTPPDEDACYSSYGTTKTNVKFDRNIEMSNVRRHATLPPVVMHQVDMEMSVHKHQECDLNTTDDIKDCTERHVKYNKLDIATSKMYNRFQLVSELEKAYNMKELKPKLHSVKLHDGGMATVPVFDFKATLLKMLNNPELM